MTTVADLWYECITQEAQSRSVSATQIGNLELVRPQVATIPSIDGRNLNHLARAEALDAESQVADEPVAVCDTRCPTSRMAHGILHCATAFTSVIHHRPLLLFVLWLHLSLISYSAASSSSSGRC